MGCTWSCCKPECQHNPQDGQSLRGAESKNGTYRFQLLLLGIDGSGKSTFLNQVKLMTDGFSAAERQQFIPIIYKNIFDTLDSLLDSLKTLNLALSVEGEDLLERYREQANNSVECAIRLQAARNLWVSERIVFEECFDRQNEFQNENRMYTNARYSISRNLDSCVFTGCNYSEEGYLPIVLDIINARRVTQEVLNYVYQDNDMEIQITDVGGGVDERQQMMEVFLMEGNLHGIIYIVAVDEYDVYALNETGEMQNRIRISLELFGQIMTHPWHMRTAFLIFLNKQDIFQRKLETSNIVKHFPEYQGFQNDVKDGGNFFRSLFRECANGRDTYFHNTQATDENNIQTVFRAIRSHILTQRLIELGLM